MQRSAAQHLLSGDPYQRLRLLTISASFGVGLALMLIKFYAWWLTRSSAILSDALESIINVVASGFAMGSVLVAAKPPDEDHPYGHGKIEYFSAGFEGALIILAACGIFYAGATKIFAPQPLPQLTRGLGLLAGAALVNLLLGLALLHVGRKTQSLTLHADGQHVLTDVYTSGGVLAGLFLVHMTGWYWLDGTLACLMGLNILYSGGKLVRHSFSALMDAADPETLKTIAELLNRERRENWIDIHQLRAWRSGNFVHADFHLILPRELSLAEAHAEGKLAENLIATHLHGRASVLIHLDPCQDPDCPVCRRHLCPQRAHPQVAEIIWKVETLILHGPVTKHDAPQDVAFSGAAPPGFPERSASRKGPGSL